MNTYIISIHWGANVLETRKLESRHDIELVTNFYARTFETAQSVTVEQVS